MKEKAYKLIHVPSFCNICPNDYWNQIQDSCEFRYATRRQRNDE